MSGERAFPNTGNNTWGMEPELGMTLRDWFAGQAIPSLLLDRALMDGYCDIGPKAFAEAAYDIANAMLAERAKIGGVS